MVELAEKFPVFIERNDSQQPLPIICDRNELVVGTLKKR
jgi:hypothetical protein